MKRRTFLGIFASATLASSAPSKSIAQRPATLDLRDPLQLARTCILSRMDPSENYRPWFAVDVQHWIPTRLRHSEWDFGDTTGRFLEGLIEVRQVVAATRDALRGEQRIREYLYSLLGTSGVVFDPERRAPDHMFSQGSALYGLVTDYQDSRKAAVRDRIKKLIAGLDRLAVHKDDYLMFPQVATKIAPCSHMAGYQVLPVVRFYELTGYPPALKYAEQLSRWVFYHDPTVTSEGVITKTGWEGHLHAWMDTFSGIIRCSRISSQPNHRAVVTRARKLYEWVRANYTSSFGWVADSVGSKTCETDTITSFMRLALELVKEGYVEYWNDVERFLRNQLVENQFGNLARLGIRKRPVAHGVHGCFESYANPTTLIAFEKETIEGCCINGGIRGLYLACEHAISRTSDEIRVNLLISWGTPYIEVVSYLPYEGRLDLHPTTDKPIVLRCPDWLQSNRVRVQSRDSHRISAEPPHNYLRISKVTPGSRIVLRFDQPERWRMHTVAGRDYRALWRGDTVLKLLPAGRPYPIFLRDSLRAGKPPFKHWDIAYRASDAYW